jgi:glycosyltransferase involved in cell wall biosynthesis
MDDGGRVALWQTILGAAGGGRPTIVVALVPPGASPEAASPVPPEFASRGIEVVRVPHRPPHAAWAALRSLAGGLPFTLERYRCPALSAVLRRLVAERRPAYVLLNHLHLAPYAADCAPSPTVLRQHNVEHLWLERYAPTLGFAPARAFARDQARRMRRAEAELCASVDLVLAIQELEARILRDLAPGAWVECLPLGVDFTRFGPRLPAAAADPPVVLLAATWSWPPNARGAADFLARGWPAVRAGVPGARLRIVGKGVPAALRDAALAVDATHGGVELAGYVPRIEEEFARAALMVVPLWEGAGVRVKIVEAVAARLPVVSTAVGVEGIEEAVVAHCPRGETAEALGAAVAGVLADPAGAALGAEAARAAALARYDLPEVSRRMRALCESLG